MGRSFRVRTSTFAGRTFLVSAEYAAGEPSSQASSTCAPYATVGAPPAVSAIAGNGQATVSWQPAQAYPGMPITGYEVFWGGQPVITAADATSAVVSNLANGIPYMFWVSALTSRGIGPKTASLTAVVPGTNEVAAVLSSATPSGDTILLKWSSPAAVPIGSILGYQVIESTGVTIEVGPSATSAEVTDLASNRKYTFSVVALGEAGAGPDSNKLAVKVPVDRPGPPVGVTAVAGDQSVRASWLQPPLDGGAPVSGYLVNVYRCELAVTPCKNKLVYHALVATKVRSLPVGDLENGTGYWLKIVAERMRPESVRLPRA
ncbi:MAG: fibronectin type III domain-containing protein [Acidimicrobiales bacterium]